MPGILLGTGDASVNKTENILVLIGSHRAPLDGSTANGGNGNMTEKTKAVYGVAESPALLF